MSSALSIALQATTATPATITGAEWDQACNDGVRLKVRALRKVMLELDGVQRGKLAPAYALAGPKIGLSADRTKKLHAAWRQSGEYALVDHRICGGCGLPGCGHGHHRSALHPSTVQAWAKLAELNGSVQTKGTRSFERAWEKLITALRNGEEVAGLGHDGELGTWRDLWHRVNATQTLPSACPWSVSCPPPGHGLSNFMRKKPKAAETTAAQRGLGQALHLLPQVRMDWGTVRPLEVIVFDDKRLDIMAHMHIDGQVQFVECWALFAMDACTRRILWAQMHPRYTRPDGKQAGISYRDMQHLVAKLLATYGVPRSYQTTLVVENASAALSHDFDDVLDRATSGQVKVKRSGLWDGRVTVGGFAQMGGNPRGKAILESFFGHRLDVAMGWVKGQIGSRYQLKPGDAQARLQYAQRVVRQIGDRATEEELAALVPFESLSSVRAHLLNALGQLENQERHELQGFEQMTFWRADEAEEWKPMTHPRMAALLAKPHGLEIVNSMLAEKGCSMTRMETGVERWHRLFSKDDFRALSPESFFDLWMDCDQVKYDGLGVFPVSIGRGGQKRVIEFRSRQHSLRAGELCQVRFDADNLDLGGVLQDAAGRVVGRAFYEGRVSYGDEDHLARQLGFKQAARSELLGGVRKRHDDRDSLAAQIDEIEGQSALITTIRDRAGSMRETTASSAELITAFKGEKTRLSRAPKITAEDLRAAELAAAGI